MIWLLDTNTIIHALNGVPGVRDRLNAAADSDRVLTSTIVMAELLYGAECSTRREENRRSIQHKLSQLEVIPVTPAIADRFGVVKAQLRSRGRLKADFDLMIAATALELGATLVSDDGDLLGGVGLHDDNPTETPTVAMATVTRPRREPLWLFMRSESS